MIADFSIHGYVELVRGKIDLGPILPAVGWGFNMDMIQCRVVGVSFWMDSAEDHVISLDLVSEGHRSAEEIVRFLQDHSADFPALSEVELGDYCRCEECGG